MVAHEVGNLTEVASVHQSTGTEDGLLGQVGRNYAHQFLSLGCEGGTVLNVDGQSECVAAKAGVDDEFADDLSVQQLDLLFRLHRFGCDLKTLQLRVLIDLKVVLQGEGTLTEIGSSVGERQLEQFGLPFERKFMLYSYLKTESIRPWLVLYSHIALVFVARLRETLQLHSEAGEVGAAVVVICEMFLLGEAEH
jgi:hypothetical protein